MERLKAKGYNGNGAGMPLSIAAVYWSESRESAEAGPGWATPTARDWKDGACSEVIESGGVTANALLGRQVVTMSWAGNSTSGTGRVLNPRFVETLMGWPTGSTNCDFSETESSLTKQLSLSKLSTGN
jgi:hypothetical protein